MGVACLVAGVVSKVGGFLAVFGIYLIWIDVLAQVSNGSYASAKRGEDEMRSFLVAVVLCGSTTAGYTEEAYLFTGRSFGACVGMQLRVKYDPPEMIREVIKQKCGKQEEQEQEQFSDFIAAHVGATLTPELAFGAL
jgi:hypothetical protein